MPPLPSLDRFPTDFLLVCPRLNQVQRLLQYTGGPASSIFNTVDETWFWRTFAKPVQDGQVPQMLSPEPRRPEELSALERLPPELMEMVLDEMIERDDMTDHWTKNKDSLLALSITSIRIWRRVSRRIRRDFIEKSIAAGNWKGQDVSFRGYSSSFTSNECDRYQEAHRWISPYTLLYVGDWIYYDSWPESEWCERLQPDWREANLARGISRSCLQRMRLELSQPWVYPQDKTWVLRNLDTRQYVRSDRLQPPERQPSNIKLPDNLPPKSRVKRIWKNIVARQSSQPRQQLEKPLTLAQIFLILTSFSNSHDYEVWPSPVPIHRGPWASAAFDLVLWEEHKTNTGTAPRDGESQVVNTSAPWTDVSDAVVADVADVRWCLRQHDMASQRQRLSPAFRKMIAESRRKHRAWAHGVEFRPGDDPPSP